MLSRRALVTTVAWSAPAVAITASAPLASASGLSLAISASCPGEVNRPPDGTFTITRVGGGAIPAGTTLAITSDGGGIEASGTEGVDVASNGIDPGATVTFTQGVLRAEVTVGFSSPSIGTVTITGGGATSQLRFTDDSCST